MHKAQSKVAMVPRFLHHGVQEQTHQEQPGSLGSPEMHRAIRSVFSYEYPLSSGPCKKSVQAHVRVEGQLMTAAETSLGSGGVVPLTPS